MLLQDKGEHDLYIREAQQRFRELRPEIQRSACSRSHSQWGIWESILLTPIHYAKSYTGFLRHLLQFALNVEGSWSYLVKSSWDNIPKPNELHTRRSLLMNLSGWGRSLSTSEKKVINSQVLCCGVTPGIAFIPGSNALWGMPPTASKPHSNSLPDTAWDNGKPLNSWIFRIQSSSLFTKTFF